jgi:hypothetical protein
MTATTLEDETMTASRPATKDFLKKKKPSTRSVDILLDTELLDIHDKILEKLDGNVPASDRRKLESELKAVNAQIEENTVTLKFKSIGRKAYEALVDAHPATPEQTKKAEEEGAEVPPYNTDTFPRALIHASSFDPELSEAEVDEIYDEWNQGEVLELFMSALLVNTQRRTADLGNAFGPIRN